MSIRITKYARPALWGFFICIVAAGVLFILKLVVPAISTHQWESERIERRAHIQQIIQQKFQQRIDELFTIASHAGSDTVLFSSLQINDAASLIGGFKHLEKYRSKEGLTLDLVDPQGNVLMWTGPSITSSYSKLFESEKSQKFVRIVQSGLRTYLTVGLGLLQNQIYLLVSEPLETNYPISNRFIKRVSFCEDLSKELSTNVNFMFSQNNNEQAGTYIVPIDNQEGKKVVDFVVSEVNRESEIVYESDLISSLISCCIGCGSLLFSIACVLWVSRERRIWLRLFISILCIWLTRLVWRAMDFPSVLMHGWLFDPHLYAAPFVFNLCSSMGELILSTTAIVISAWLFMKGIIFAKLGEVTIDKFGKRIGLIGVVIVLSIIVLFILWIFRGFAESIRSFVFDSTIQYNKPSEIIPESTTTVMHLAILMLGFSLLSVSVSLLWLWRSIFSKHYSREKLKSTIIILITFLACIPLFIFLDQSAIIPLYSFFVLLTLMYALFILLSQWKSSGITVESQKSRIIIWSVLCASLLGEPILHEKLQQKEHKEVENSARELLRPSDSWLTYIVLEGLHGASDELSKGEISKRLLMAKEENLAFILWTKSLIGKEGYNSALVVYDSLGNEADRFVVGMNKPEQQNILTAVFEGEEEAIRVVSQPESRAVGKLYGAWTTVRNQNGKVIASIAILLSKHQKAIFNEEESEPLRQSDERFESKATREIAFHEYRNDSLLYSTGKYLYPDRFLPVAIDSDLKKEKTTVLWKDITINNHHTQTVFVTDISSPDKIGAVSLEELDFRWDLFNYLKAFIIYLIVILFIGVFLLTRSKQRFWRTMGFRGRLLIGFSCIVLLPLVILGFYNRQLAAETTKEQIASLLYNELDQLQDRVRNYIVDQEDFIYGVTDEFCEALAAEYGIDFSIYRHSMIQASSRSELYRASLLDRRLNGEAYASVVLGEERYFLTTERIGSVEYIVGYTPIYINGSVAGVLSVPTLNRQKEIEAEVAQRNAYVFGIYAVVFGIALMAGALLALRFARPLRELTFAARVVSKGNLDVTVETRSQDEIGELTQSFNDMVAKLKKSRSELAKHERESAWREMAKQVAHEIRNPLTPIKLSMQHVRQAFKDRVPNREEILQRVIQTVIDQIDTLSHIASEFSRFAKLPASKYERLNIEELLTETISLFKEVHDVDFIMNLSSQHPTVVADHDKLRGVFVNIVKNAIQAMEGKGIITIETVFEEHTCIVRISDTGQGISDEVRLKIFEPNFSTKTEGMGLGLAIAKEVIEDHGGTISCSSEQGKGTAFEIRLPV